MSEQHQFSASNEIIADRKLSCSILEDMTLHQRGHCLFNRSTQLAPLQKQIVLCVASSCSDRCKTQCYHDYTTRNPVERSCLSITECIACAPCAQQYSLILVYFLSPQEVYVQGFSYHFWLKLTVIVACQGGGVSSKKPPRPTQGS